MSKFLIKASYSVEGARGLKKDGGTGRRTAVQNLVEGVGGKLEAFYFAFGTEDVYIICDVPDATTAVSISLAVNGTGGAHTTTVPLITVEDMDAACKKTPTYRAPGT
jgi:uncharacterized protein with GYD domain